MTLGARLRAIEKRIVPRYPPRELKTRFILGDGFIPKGKGGKGLDRLARGVHEDDVLIVKVVKGPKTGQAASGTCPVPDNGRGDVTAELKIEIKRLEARKRQLLAKAKA